MTLLEIDLKDVLSETDTDDRVVVWAPVLREGPSGALIGTRRKTIPLADGVGSDEVVPGPLMVQVQCKGIADTRPREVVVPEVGPVTLTGLMDGAGAFTYAPPVIGRVAQMRDAAEAARAGAEGARDVTVEAAGTVAGAEVTITEARDQAVQAAQTTTADRQATTQDRTAAQNAAQNAEAWATSMTDVALVESPPGSGLFLVSGQSVTEDPDNSGLYLIGA